jgi:S1-C subfamily serine protease
VTIAPALVVLLATSILLFAAPNAIKRVQIADLSAQVALAQDQIDNSTLLERLNRDVSAIADSVLPSVVHLSVIRGPQAENAGGRFSNGSGWVLTDRGHVVTNYHVIAGAERIRVEFFDGRVTRGELLSVDRRTDIAVVKVDPGPGVLPIRQANGQPLRVGERVYAFGSPFGIKFSMSEGIVSGLGRSDGANMLGLSPGYTNYIQTDAAINPGNSGGPLVDTNGRLVGMNTAIANSAEQGFEPGVSGQSAGIGFAVPLETIERVTEQLVDDKIILRGYLGVSFNVRRDARLVLEDRGQIGDGVLIDRVPRGEPADRAGIEPGDVITAINGRPTPTPDILRAIISVQRPGSPADFTVIDDEGDARTVRVNLGAAVDQGRRGLLYSPGSSEMTPNEARAWVRARRGS